MRAAVPAEAEQHSLTRAAALFRLCTAGRAAVRAAKSTLIRPLQLRTIESLSSADERAAIAAACAAAAHSRRKPKKPRRGTRSLPTGSGAREPSAAASRLSELGFESAAIGAAFIIRACSGALAVRWMQRVRLGRIASKPYTCRTVTLLRLRRPRSGQVALHAADGDVDRAAEILMLEAQHQMQHVRCVAMACNASFAPTLGLYSPG